MARVPKHRSAGGKRAVRDALARLGIERLVLSIQQASFPASGDDLGVGAPSSARGRAFLRFAAELGFTGVLLGPGGITTPYNPSPYDSTWFSLDPVGVSFERLAGDAWGGALEAELLARVSEEARARAGSAERCDHEGAHGAATRLYDALDEAVRARPGRVPELVARGEAFRASSPWLAHERAWVETHERRTGDRFELEQLVADEDHAALRAHARELGLALYADAHIGLGERDTWGRDGIVLKGYRMGAPPSRTNPDGQPWGYPVLDPRHLGPGGAGRTFLEQRFDGLIARHDGIRLDHPHGWVCPWVYRVDDADRMHAVQTGARLHESPALADHPELAALARVRADQIDGALPRYADDRVRCLEPAQVDSYAVVIDAIMARAAARGLARADLMVEVLSTCPRPLREVLARHGLGRFRVTQKAKVADPRDGYRGDQADAPDWIMVGNHDTPPLLAVTDAWAADGAGEGERRAAYLAGRLGRDETERAVMTAAWARDARALGQAMLAELFLGPARHVQVFWVDLFGGRENYNVPGTVSPDNWVLRVPRDFEDAYERAVAEDGAAPSMEKALAMALHARGLDADEEGWALARVLGGT